MSANIVVTTDEMKGVLRFRAQALFESDGRHSYCLRDMHETGKKIAADRTTPVRRNEMRVVLTGVNEGQLVALASPVDNAKKKTGSGSAMPSLPK